MEILFNILVVNLCEALGHFYSYNTSDPELRHLPPVGCSFSKLESRVPGIIRYGYDKKLLIGMFILGNTWLK